MSNPNYFEFCRNVSLSVVDLFCLEHNFTTCIVSSFRNDELVGRVQNWSGKDQFPFRGRILPSERMCEDKHSMDLYIIDRDLCKIGIDYSCANMAVNFKVKTPSVV
jgi:hypothetical protein